VKDGAGVKDRLLDRDVEFAAKCGRILIIVGRRGSSKTNGKNKKKTCIQRYKSQIYVAFKADTYEIYEKLIRYCLTFLDLSASVRNEISPTGRIDTRFDHCKMFPMTLAKMANQIK